MPRPGARLPRPPARHRSLRAWHAPCMLLGLSGCFVFGPPDYLAENQPPEVVESSFPDNGTGTLVLESEVETLFVVATDDDGDELGFVWTVGGDIVPNAIGIEDGSTITLDVTEDLDGLILECKIYDGVSDPVTLDAILEVP